MKKYGTPPVEIAKDLIIPNTEMYFYQYLPVYMPDVGFHIPQQLNNIQPLVYECMQDYAVSLGRPLNDTYVYLTAKSLYVPSGGNINRMGWHCDGFMSEDINYIWSDCIPTEYVEGSYDLVQDHIESISQMNRLFYHDTPKETVNNSLYRLDETVIHRCGYNKERNAVLRHFIKVSFSKEKYNLLGNSHNYGLGYKWDMVERGIARNHPSK